MLILIFLVTELKKMYKTAPEGYQMTYVHLFGIRYAVELSKHSLKNIAIEATSKDSLHVEIGKGVKLAEYVVEKRDDFENISDSKIDLYSDKLTYKIDVTGKDLKKSN